MTKYRGIRDHYVFDEGNVKGKLMKFVEKQANGCWRWMKTLGNHGYGLISFNGRSHLAHRVSYELHKGKLGRKFACHTCDNKWCVNPDHIFPGSPADNLADAAAKGRFNNKGSNHGMSKLNEAKVRAIKKLLAKGLSHPEIAAKFNVSRPNISMIASGKRWAHV